MKKLLLVLVLSMITGNARAQWVQADNPENVRLGVGGFGILGDTLFTGSAITAGFDSDPNALYKSGDNGTTWIKADAQSGLRNADITFYSLSGLDNTLILSRRRQLLISEDGGLNWEASGNFSTDDEGMPRHFVKLDNIIVGAAQGDTNDGADGVFRKEGDGEWEAANEGLPDGRDGEIAPQVFSLIESEGRIIGTFGSEVYFSDDTAKTWNRFTGFGTHINYIAAGNGMVLGAGFRSGQAYLYKSETNGRTFERLDTPSELRSGIRKLHFSDGKFYAAASGVGGIYVTEDALNWSFMGLKNALITQINSTEANILVTVQNWSGADSLRGVWTYPKSEVVITSAEHTELPSFFRLHQNYPNPFNPGTTIGYELMKPGAVQLDIFNLAGQKIVSLVDGVKTAGSHSINFDASGLSTGIYLYRLKVGESVQVRKMMLIK